MKKVFAIMFAAVVVLTVLTSASASERNIYPTRINSDAEDDDIVIYTRAFGESITDSEANYEHGFSEWLVISARYSNADGAYVVNAVYRPGTAEKHVSIPTDGFVVVYKPQGVSDLPETSTERSDEPLISTELPETSFVSNDQSGGLMSTVESLADDILPTAAQYDIISSVEVGKQLYLYGIDIAAGTMIDGAYISLDEIPDTKLPNEVSDELQVPSTSDIDIRAIAVILLVVSAAAFLGLKYRKV